MDHRRASTNVGWPFGGQRLRAIGVASAALLGSAGSMWLAAGCSARQPAAAVAVDCDAEAPYDLSLSLSPPKGENYEEGGTPLAFNWYNYGDLTPGGWQTGIDGGFASVPIEGNGRCGTSKQSLLLESHGHQDYGSGWGTYVYAATGVGFGGLINCTASDAGATICTPFDASHYEGMSFWARSLDPAGRPTSKGVIFEINDTHSYAAGADGGCVAYDAGTLANGTAIYLPTSAAALMGAAGGMATSAVPPVNACGNPYRYSLLTTDRWQFYTIPFSSFTQAALPNRVPTGFDPTAFMQITIAVPKESALELWLDDVGFYRTRHPEAGP